MKNTQIYNLFYKVGGLTMLEKYYNKIATDQLISMFTFDKTGLKDTLVATDSSYEQVKTYLKLGADPNSSFLNPHGCKQPLLSFASLTCNTRLVNLLLDHGANPNTRDRFGRSCLGLALSSQPVTFVTDDTVNPLQGKTIFEEAKTHFFDRVGTVKTLLSHGANVNVFKKTNETPLQNILTANLKGTLYKESFLENHFYYDENSNIDFSIPVFISEKLKVFDSHFEAFASKEEQNLLFEALIEHSIPTEIKDKKGFTGLHYALLTNQDFAVRKLIDAGANVNAKSYKGITPLHIAASKGNTEMVSLLLAKGADAFYKDKLGRDSISIALSSNQSNIAVFILENAPRKSKTSCFGLISNQTTRKETLKNRLQI